MKRTELMESLHQKIDDLNYKIGVLGDMASGENDIHKKKEMESVLKDMEKARDRYNAHYDALNSLADTDEREISEMERNIFSDIRTFDDSFKKAGKIFHTR